MRVKIVLTRELDAGLVQLDNMAGGQRENS